MAESVSIQNGYILKAEAIPTGNLPLQFILNDDGKLEMNCKIIFPKTLGGAKINNVIKPNDPAQWEYGEIEVLLGKNINSNENPEVFFTGMEDELTLNLRIRVTSKKTWQMGADSKTWQMG